jgi:hypothetical protein
VRAFAPPMSLNAQQPSRATALLASRAREDIWMLRFILGHARR